MKTKIIECEVYKCSPLFIWDCTATEMLNYLKSKENIEIENPEQFNSSGGTVLTLDTDDGIFRVVWIRDKKLTFTSIGRVAHEVVHLCVRILEDKGVPYDSYRNADESLAYLVDYFIRKLYKKN